MFGKSLYTLDTVLPEEEILSRIEAWRAAHRLVNMSRGMAALHFRHGSRYLSNPIHIQIGFGEECLRVAGWVQTSVKFVSWTLVETEREGLWTMLDNRRKGGLFISRLRQALADPAG